MLEIRARSAAVGVEVRSDFPIPSICADFLSALDRLVTSPQSRVTIRVDVREDPVGQERARVRRDFVPPASGVLSSLPPSSRARMLVSHTGESLGMEWYEDAGTLVAQRNSGHCEVFASGPSAPLGWMINYVVAALIARGGACTAVHASAVRFAGKNVLIGGPSGSGKTSLALRLFHHGGGLLTEDITYIDGFGRFAPQPIRDFMHVRAGTFRALPWLGRFLSPASARALRVVGSGEDLVAAGRALEVEVPFSHFHLPEAGIDPQPVDLVVLPRLDADARTIAVEVVDPWEIEQGLRRSLPSAVTRWTEELIPTSALQPWEPEDVALPRATGLRVVLPLDCPDGFDAFVARLHA